VLLLPQNIDKAKKEIARLEAEESAQSNGSDAKVENLASTLEATTVKE